MTACPHQLSLNVAAISGHYSQVAGILAGFAFSAVAVLMTIRTTPGGPRIQLGGVAKVLLSAFLALIVTSVGYAVMAGETVSSGRAATEEVIIGTAFGMSAVLLVMAIVLVLDEVHAAENGTSLRDAANFVRVVLGQGVTALVTFYVYLGLDDVQDARFGPGRDWGLFDSVGLVMVLLQIVVNAASYRRLAASPWSPADREKAIGYVAGASIVTVILTAVVFGTTSILIRDACSTLPGYFPYTVLVVNVGLMLGANYAAMKLRIA